MAASVGLDSLALIAQIFEELREKLEAEWGIPKETSGGQKKGVFAKLPEERANM